MVKCIEEIKEKYYKDDNLNLSDLVSVASSAEHTEDIKEYDLNVTKETAAESVSENELINVEEKIMENEENGIDEVLKEIANKCVQMEYFQILPTAPRSHKFHLTICHPSNPQIYYRAVQKEHRMLRTSLPPGVWVKYVLFSV